MGVSRGRQVGGAREEVCGVCARRDMLRRMIGSELHLRIGELLFMGTPVPLQLQIPLLDAIHSSPSCPTPLLFPCLLPLLFSLLPSPPLHLPPPSPSWPPHLPPLSTIYLTDYLRAFTWDKRLEMWIKRDILVTPGSRGLLPTIISPNYYRNRFLEAMDQYFAVIPDKWYGLTDETWPR